MASELAGPLALTGLLALAIVILTLRHHPWKNQYGAPTWDFSTSFAMNLAVLAGAVNAFLQLAVGGVTAAAKSQALMEAAVFAIITASAPLLGAIWKAPGGKTYFAGVVAAVLATATGAFGQVQVLLQLLSPATKSNDGFRATLYFADAAVFVYCLSTANLLARTPVAGVAKVAAAETAAEPAPARWALP